MKKLLTIMFFMALSVVAMYGMADAITGQCSNCHTMHDSQDGVDGGGPNDLLLKGSGCGGCHTQNGLPSAPQVDLTSNLSAGGSFDTTTIATDDSMRHDVQDLSLTESAITSTPGKTGSILTVAPNALTCAGAVGCHGKHVTGMGSDAGIKGSHHAPNATYRFLWIGTTTSPTAVLGIGDVDYEVTVDDSDHNVYSAHATQSISTFCNQCHNQFHGEPETGGPSSPWIRHPTDIALFSGPVAWDSAKVNIHANDAPIALIAIGANTTTTNYYSGGTPGLDETNSAVMCLSCHRAHGTANADLLRWSYATVLAGGAKSKCLSCHYKQSNAP